MFGTRRRRGSTSSVSTIASSRTRSSTIESGLYEENETETCTHNSRRWETVFAAAGCDVFTPRTGHTVVEFNGSIYLFGGTDSSSRKNDLYRFCVESKVWTLIKTKGCKPSIRSGAVSCVMDDKMYVFGGYDGRDGNYYNDLYEFDFLKESWKFIRAKKKPVRRIQATEDTESVQYYRTPEPRTDHVVVPYNKCLYVFGGYDGTHRFDKVYAYDTQTGIWRIEGRDSRLKPSSRFGHSGVVYKHEFYLFGGWDGHVTLEDMWKYSFSSQTWSKVSPRSNKSHNLHVPSNRYRHSAVVHNEYMYIFGGVDKDHTRFNDLHRFHFESQSWEEVDHTGIVPSTRTFHRAVVVDARMYVIGGYDGDNRLNDLRSIHVGNFSVPSLVEICARHLRTSMGKVCIDRDDVVAQHIANLVWKRDSEGVLRGCLSSSYKRNTCFGFEPSGATGTELYAAESRKCAACGLDAFEHDEILESKVFRTNLPTSWQPEMETASRQSQPKNPSNATETKKRRMDTKLAQTSLGFLRKSMLINNVSSSMSISDSDSEFSDVVFVEHDMNREEDEEAAPNEKPKPSRTNWLPSRRRKSKKSTPSALQSRLRSHTKKVDASTGVSAWTSSRQRTSGRLRSSGGEQQRDVLGDLLTNICFPGEESKH